MKPSLNSLLCVEYLGCCQFIQKSLIKLCNIWSFYGSWEQESVIKFIFCQDSLRRNRNQGLAPLSYDIRDLSLAKLKQAKCLKFYFKDDLSISPQEKIVKTVGGRGCCLMPPTLFCEMSSLLWHCIYMTMGKLLSPAISLNELL